MSLPATTGPTQLGPAPFANVDNAELRALIEQLGHKLEEARQELKSDIQSKLPSSRRFSWVLLFIAIQVVQGIIVVRYTVRAAATALDSANIPEMTTRYSEALHESRQLVTDLNQNVSTLSGLVAETTEAWKTHVQSFVRELPKVQESYEKAAGRFNAEAATIPQRIVDKFFEAEDVKRSMAAYNVGVESAAGTVQQRSDDGIAASAKAYEARITSAEAVAHFERQVEKRFDASKDRIADVLAANAKAAAESTSLKEKLDGFWDAGLLPTDGARPEGWLYRKLREQAEGAPVDDRIAKAVDAALLPPLQRWFEAQLAPHGQLAARLARDQDKVPGMPQLVSELVKKRVEAAIALPPGEKVAALDDILREIVKARVNVALSSVAAPRGPVTLTCK
jgi:hypothetical protein